MAWTQKRGKYVYVSSGGTLVGVVNMQTNEISKFVLSSNHTKILWITEEGNYNGFKSLEENTSILFFSTTTLDESLGDDIRKISTNGIFGKKTTDKNMKIIVLGSTGMLGSYVEKFFEKKI